MDSRVFPQSKMGVKLFVAIRQNIWTRVCREFLTEPASELGELESARNHPPNDSPSRLMENTLHSIHIHCRSESKESGIGERVQAEKTKPFISIRQLGDSAGRRSNRPISDCDASSLPSITHANVLILRIAKLILQGDNWEKLGTRSSRTRRQSALSIDSPSHYSACRARQKVGPAGDGSRVTCGSLPVTVVTKAGAQAAPVRFVQLSTA